jgi:hypothetical protein
MYSLQSQYKMLIQKQKTKRLLGGSHREGGNETNSYVLLYSSSYMLPPFAIFDTILGLLESGARRRILHVEKRLAPILSRTIFSLDGCNQIDWV